MAHVDASLAQRTSEAAAALRLAADEPLLVVARAASAAGRPLRHRAVARRDYGGAVRADAALLGAYARAGTLPGRAATGSESGSGSGSESGSESDSDSGSDSASG